MGRDMSAAHDPERIRSWVPTGKGYRAIGVSQTVDDVVWVPLLDVPAFDDVGYSATVRNDLRFEEER